MKTTKKLLQYFLCYGFLGWILEGVFNLVTAGQFRKANFLHLPMKPMYGFGALAILIAHRYWPRKIFLTSCFLPCLVEYCSGYFLEHCFALRYWDYRQEFVQIKGYVCLKFACCWLILTQIVVHLVQPVLACLLKVLGKWKWFWREWTKLFILDAAVTCYQRKYRDKRVVKYG